MADDSQRTEKPTPQRLKKARQEGQFPAAREFVSAAQFFAFVMLAAAYAPNWILTVQTTFRMGLRQAFSASLTASDLLNIFNRLARATLEPLAVLGCILLAVTFALQMAATNLGFSLTRLAPKFDRLNPASRLSQMPGNNMASFLQALVMIPVMFWLTWTLVRDRLPEVMRLPMMPVANGAAFTGMLLKDALKKASFLLVLLGIVMLIRERARYGKSLRMSKQEIRDESKDNEGNPR